MTATSDASPAAEAIEIAIHDAVTKWLLDENSEDIRALASHASTATGRYEHLLTALADVFHNGARPTLPEAAGVLDGDPLALLREVAEAVQERDLGREVPLTLYVAPPLDALPIAVRAYVEGLARVMAVDHAYALLPTLAAMSGAAGISRRVRINSTWAEPPLLWTALVAPSGSRKSPPMEAALEGLRAVEEADHARYMVDREEYDRVRVEHEAAMGDWKKTRGARGQPPEAPREPPEPRRIVGDVTMEGLAAILADSPRGVLVARDELSGWLASLDMYRGGRGGDASAWEELWRGGPLRVDRRSTDPATGRRRRVYGPRAAAAVLGTIQPAVLKRRLNQELIDGGFAARILWALPPAAVRPPADQELPSYLLAGWRRLIARLAHLPMGTGERGELEPVDLPLEDEARQEWRAWVDAWAKERDGLNDGDLASAAAKLEGYAARLALLVHLAEWSEGDQAEPGPVSGVAMKAGVRLTRWFWREAQRVYRLTLGAGAGLPAQLLALVRWLERRDGQARPHEAASGPRIYRGKVEQAEKDMQKLVDLGLARWLTLPASTPTGRASRAIRLVAGHASP